MKKNTYFTATEIYPKIMLYSGILDDVERKYEILKQSSENKDDRIFDYWEQWSRFGEYLNPIIKSVDWQNKKINVHITEPTSTIKEDQKKIAIEIMNVFHLVSKNYSDKYDLNINYEDKSLDFYNNYVNTWQNSAPVICKYNMGTQDNVDMTMNYHSDYIREPITSPGYKFAITVLGYFNDNYIGGEIDFAIGKDLFKYKPKAGDFLVFPSGHPEILTKNNSVYLHAVMPLQGGDNKYFLRMFWHKYHQGATEWHAKEKEFGSQEWAKMQDGIMEEFRNKHPQRSLIEGGVRI